MKRVTWLAMGHRDIGGIARLDLMGDLRGSAAGPLHFMLVQKVVADRPEEFVVGLDAVSALDEAGTAALMSGYVAALEHGTAYRVVGATGAVRGALYDAGVLDVLADSDDLGALMLAVLRLPTGH